uniref:uncharacterized protein LOC105351205 n=1 Tax=Fragaria vesca subsp. vesca TaxID=101020 RepID=UPI0005C879F6|nr:PREDICTED: uncharacterized protein LOC105351205 [Fragaria vesca subsp. vesca]XP_011463278.1 PREDICTED: uncharacterized protein LOC105351205 [Fragaria vesca subsp. vesca]
MANEARDSSEEHTPPEEPNPSPLDQDERVFALTANEDIPADDDGFLRAVYQFWCNISRHPTLTQNFRLPPTQTRNIRLPPHPDPVFQVASHLDPVFQAASG